MKPLISLSFGLFVVSLFFAPVSTQAGGGMIAQDCNQFFPPNYDYNTPNPMQAEYDACMKEQQYQYFLRELDTQMETVKSIVSDIHAIEETFSGDIPSEKKQMAQKLIRLTGFYVARSEQKYQELIEFSKTEKFDPYNYYGLTSGFYRYQSRLEIILQQFEDVITGIDYKK